jgi:type I restriction enzyme, S subunit
MSELPQGWTKTTISALCGSGQYGWTTKSSIQGDVKYLRTTDITRGQIDWNSTPFCQEPPTELGKYRIRKNDILISRAGSVGFSTLIKKPPFATVFASYLIRFIPAKEIEARYLAFFLKSPEYWQQISEASSGSAMANVNAKKLAEISVPLAPLNEQKRIADKLDRLLAKVDNCRERLDRIPLIIRRFRQSVLDSATSGQITEDWREKNICLDWKRQTLQDVANIIDPHPSHRTPKEAAEGIPYVGIGDLDISGCFDFTNARKVSRDILQEHRERYQLKEGDFIFGKIGTLGKATPLPMNIEYTLSANVILIQPNSTLVEHRFLMFFLQSPKTMEEIMNQSNSTSQAAFGIKKMRLFEFLLPSLSEQKEIVRRAEILFDFADRLEARYQTARTQIDKLTPALLDKAFKGELVPQDPTDEPAAALLAKIQPIAAKPKANRKSKAN